LERSKTTRHTNIFVIPAQAGIHLLLLGPRTIKMDSRFRGNDGIFLGFRIWRDAKATR